MSAQRSSCRSVVFIASPCEVFHDGSSLDHHAFVVDVLAPAEAYAPILVQLKCPSVFGFIVGGVAGLHQAAILLLHPKVYPVPHRLNMNVRKRTPPPTNII